MTFFHVSHIKGLSELMPFHGKVFVTDKKNVLHWAGYVRTKFSPPLDYEDLVVYRVEVPEDVRLGHGMDGPEFGDFFIETQAPLPVTPVAWDWRRNRPRKVHRNKYAAQ